MPRRYATPWVPTTQGFEIKEEVYKTTGGYFAVKRLDSYTATTAIGYQADHFKRADLALNKFRKHLEETGASEIERWVQGARQWLEGAT